MPKTIILAIFTLCLAVAALVTDVVSPYAGGVDSAASNIPARSQHPARSPQRTPERGEVQQASTDRLFEAL